MLADQFDSIMLLLVLIAQRVVAVAVDEEVVADSEIEDAEVGVVDEAAVADLEIGVDEVDPEVAAVEARTEGASVTSKARSRLFKSRGIA